MNIEEYLEKLGIDKHGEWNDNNYILPLEDSNEFARVYTKLENASWLTLIEGDLSLQEEASSLLYVGDNIQFKLKSDFIKDEYYLVVTMEE